MPKKDYIILMDGERQLCYMKDENICLRTDGNYSEWFDGDYSEWFDGDYSEWFDGSDILWKDGGWLWNDEEYNQSECLSINRLVND